MSHHTVTSQGSRDYYNSPGGYRRSMVPSLENELLSPPGGPTLHPPPHSPKLLKQMELMQQELSRSDKEKEHLKKENDDLRRKAEFTDFTDTRYGAEASADMGTMDDATIRQLQRTVTLLQAELYYKDQRMCEMSRENELMDQKLHTMVRQHDASRREVLACQGHLEELKGLLGQRQGEIDRLARDKQADKDRISLLEKENRAPSSPPASSSSHSQGAGAGAGLASLLSNTNYVTELEYLHKMVDTLKATVLDQRRLFQRMGLQSRPFNSLPQTHPNGGPARPDNQTQSCNNISTTHTASLAPQHTASLAPQPPMVTSSRPLRQPEENSDASPPSSGGNIPAVPSQTAAFDFVSRTRGLNLDAGNATSAISHNNLDNGIYMNVRGPGLARQKDSDNSRINSPPLGTLQGFQPSYSHDNSSPRMRKSSSHTDIISRQPRVAVPVKSHTDVITVRSPDHLIHHQRRDDVIVPPRRMGIAAEGEVIVPQYPPDIPPVACPLPSVSSPRLVMEQSARNNGIRPLSSWHQATTTTPQPTQPQRSATAPILGHHHTHAPSSHPDPTSSVIPRPTRPQDDRLCPVCNQHFYHSSMEEFQTHVFDCFDNDNGPETLLPELASDFPPPGPTAGRTCPMCQRKFEVSVSQADFEQHVHQHFGEEPFEVVN